MMKLPCLEYGTFRGTEMCRYAVDGHGSFWIAWTELHNTEFYILL